MILDTIENTLVITQEQHQPIIQLIKNIEAEYSTFKSRNIIVNLSNLGDFKSQDVSEFLKISNSHRANKQSFVLVSDKLDIDTLPDDIVLVPTLQEAHDLIEMDDIERDLGF